jgi:hypothetical protein
MIKIELKSILELIALHRGLLEARFCEIPNDPDVSGSPILSRLHRDVVSQIIDSVGLEKAESWRQWLAISPLRREWSIAIERARSASLWDSQSKEFKAAFALDLLSPFEVDASLVARFIDEVDGC